MPAPARACTTLEIIETIPAGHRPRKTLNPGTCAKIMTGGMVPEGADRVISRERVEEKATSINIEDLDPWKNICYQGEDLQKGQKILEAGTRIRQQEIALLSAVGCSSIQVSRLPKVGIISTGSELLKAGKK